MNSVHLALISIKKIQKSDQCLVNKIKRGRKGWRVMFGEISR